MFRYRLHSPDGDDLGEATYAMMIKPGEEILVGKGLCFSVLDVVPFEEDDESPAPADRDASRSDAAAWWPFWTAANDGLGIPRFLDKLGRAAIRWGTALDERPGPGHLGQMLIAWLAQRPSAACALNGPRTHRFTGASSVPGACTGRGIFDGFH